MNPAETESPRKSVYALLITVAVSIAAGRILCAELVYEPSLPERWPATLPKATPTFGSNDRSRWATIRNLVQEGTFVIGKRTFDPNKKTYRDEGITFKEGYFSVDKVLNPETKEFYSSKPPLLTTIMAGEYWVLYHLGLSIDDHPWLVVRIILFTFNWLPLLFYLFLLSRLVERFGRTDWGRYFVLAAACFATLVPSFSIVLNNHMPATFCAFFALYASLSLSRSRAFIAGLFAGLAVCCELPALALTAGLFLLLLVRSPGRALAFFVPMAALPLAAYLAVNYIEIGQLAPVQAQFGNEWYSYEGSNWNRPDGSGIDYARFKETRAEYAFHIFLGHHGIFSLSPIYLLTAVGIAWGAIGIWKTGSPGGPDSKAPAPRAGVPAVLVLLTLYLSVTVIGFYLIKSDNYGGWTSGLRWLMWLIPFWLLTMLPVADSLAKRRWTRLLGCLLLAVSVMSVNYRAWNPWRHPWLYDLMQALGWPGY